MERHAFVHNVGLVIHVKQEFKDVIVDVRMEELMLMVFAIVLLVILGLNVNQVIFLFSFFLFLFLFLFFFFFSLFSFLSRLNLQNKTIIKQSKVQTCPPITSTSGNFPQANAYEIITGSCSSGSGKPKRQCLHDGTWQNIINPCSWAFFHFFSSPNWNFNFFNYQ